MEKLLISLLTLLLTSFSFAQDEDFDELALNGMASYEQLRTEYYIGAIYLESISKDPEAIITMDGRKRIEIRITAKKWSPRRFAQHWNQALLINNDQEGLNEFADQIQKFSNLPKDDLLAGDQILVDMTPGIGVTVYLNRQKAFSTRNTDFFNLLVNTWIGMRPPSTEFKNSILTLPTDQAGTDLLLRFDSIKPASARIKTVAKWFEEETPKVTDSSKSGKQKTSAGGGEPSQATTKAGAVVTTTAIDKPKAIAIEPTVTKPVIAPAKVTLPATSTAPTKAEAAASPKPATKPTLPKSKQDPVVKTAPKTEPVKPADDKELQARLHRNYRDSVMKLTYVNTQYPKRALKKRWEGLVILKVTLNRKGEVLSIEEEQSSDHSSFNKAAKSAVEKSGVYPPAPKELNGEKIILRLPFNFKL